MKQENGYFFTNIINRQLSLTQDLFFENRKSI